MPYNNITDRTAAGPLISEEVSSEIFQATVEASAVLSLARRLPNMSSKQHRTPVYDSVIEAEFVNGDSGLKQTAEAAWGNVFITAEEIAVMVPVPDAVADDADYDIFGELKPRITEAFGRKIDRAVMFGPAGTPASWPDDLLTGATAASHIVDLSTQVGLGQDLYDIIMDVDGLLGLVEADGYEVNGHVAAMTMKARLRGLRDGVGQPIFHRSLSNGQNVQAKAPYELDGEPMFFPKNGAIDAATALMFSGDWSQLVYRIRQDITFKVFDQGVITDGAGNITYNAMQQDGKVLRAVMRLGWALPNPVNAMNDNDTTRYPFAVLVP